MRIFLDSSVLLAACASDTGEIFCLAHLNRWDLLTTPYVLEEVLHNLAKLPSAASAVWARLRPDLILMDDILTVDRPIVFESAKDRPILLSALAWADVLLTLDRADFGGLLGQPFYSLMILEPGSFLMQERTASRLKEIE